MGTTITEFDKQQKLLQEMEERGFTLCQQNGQRTYGGPPPNWGARPPPHRDSEVFIGRIPRLCFEDELIPLFLTAGELYEFRLMLDFSGTNRGYGYAHYATLEGAMNAIKILHRYEIRPGHHIGVLKSKNNCRLLFGNVKQGITYEAFNEFIRSVTSQVLKVSLFADFEQLRATDSNMCSEMEEAFFERQIRSVANCQFAIVEYENHKSAAMARRSLIPKYGHILDIDWAIPPREKKRYLQMERLSSFPSRKICSPSGNKCSVVVNASTKSRPVPTLMTSPTLFDNLPPLPTAFRNIVKYFKFLINITLHGCMQKGRIPLNVYLEIEKKIVDRIKNLEHCGQAVQLIFNYLSWYNEKKFSMIDTDSLKILHEVKVYSDVFVNFIFHKITFGKPLHAEVEIYYSNILPTQLNFIYHMALILTGEERVKVCGKISSSINWFNEIIDRIRSGDSKLKEFMMQIITNAVESEEDRRELARVKDLWNNYRYTQLNPALEPSTLYPPICPNVGVLRNDFSKEILSASSGYQTFIDDSAADTCSEFDMKEGNNLKSNTFHDEAPCRNLVVDSPNALRNFPTFLLSNNPKTGLTCVSDRATELKGCYDIDRNPDFMDSKTTCCDSDVKSPSLQNKTNQTSLTDYVPYMPNAFYNVVKYFKYIINESLQKSVEKCEVPLHKYNEISTKIMDGITNLEKCSEGVGLILNYLYRDDSKHLIGQEIYKILREVKLYSNSFLTFIQSQESYGPPPTRELHDYYCRILPYELSFIYHMALVLTGEEKTKLSGRITDALQWLNELINKIRSGIIQTEEFFLRVSRIAMEKMDEELVQNLVKEAYEEYNLILNFLSSK